MDSGEKSLDKLITSLEEELKTIKQDKSELSERLEKATELESHYKIELEKLTKEVKAEKKKALEETEQFLTQTRKDIEHLVAEIRKSQASDKAVKEFHHKLKSSQDSVANLRNKEKPKKIIQSKFYKNDTVEIISMNQVGEIEDLIGKEKAKIKIGNIFTTVELRNLRKIEKQSDSKKRPAKVYSSNNDENFSPEIHLRGMTVEEAMEKLDKFLDRAVINGLTQVYVIHGKGAGILRNMLTVYMKKHSEVASLRLGDFNEGGAGVTVVKLKE